MKETTSEVITSPVIEFEIVPKELGLDLVSKNSVELAFTGFFATVAKWKAKAATITDAKEARTARLEIKALRVEVEKKHKDLKADSLLFGRAVDGAKNIFLAMATPIERELDDIEKAEERAEAARLEALRRDRENTIVDLGGQIHGINLGTFTDEQWKAYHQQAEDAAELRAIREVREREAAAAKELKEIEEREAQRLENIRLREEAQAERLAAAAEAKRKDAELAAEREAAEIARKQVEAELLKEREAAAAERAAREAEAKAAEKKAEAERQKVNTARLKAEAEAKALRDAEAKRIADEEAKAKAVAAEVAAKAKAEALAAKKAAAAPDKTKLLEFAITVRNMPVPPVKSDVANEVRDDITAKLESFANWIEATVSVL